MKTACKREALSRERILGAALGVVDREGLEAISMRRVGEELGVEAMSLYNHVTNKAAILDGIFEAVLSELSAAKRSVSWQAALKDRARALRAVLRAHPNTLPIFATRPAVTSASMVHVEAVLDTLRNAGFSADKALSALQVMVSFVVGHTVATCSPRKPDEYSRPIYTQLSAERFPRVREAALLLGTHDLEKEFELGVDAMLAGLASTFGIKRRPLSSSRRF
jgi:AcrR family transcriptional regulator